MMQLIHPGSWDSNLSFEIKSLSSCVACAFQATATWVAAQNHCMFLFQLAKYKISEYGVNLNKECLWEHVSKAFESCVAFLYVWCILAILVTRTLQAKTVDQINSFDFDQRVQRVWTEIKQCPKSQTFEKIARHWRWIHPCLGRIFRFHVVIPRHCICSNV